MNKFAALPAILLWAAAAAASEPCPKYSPDWENCRTAQDCIIGQTECYAVSAYNRNSIDAVKAYNECRRPMIRCVAPPADDKEKIAVTCMNGKCAAIKPIPPSLAASAPSGTQDECQSDSECVSLPSVNPACRHEDPEATEVCPAVNRKYKDEIGRISCYRSVGCRRPSQILCKNGRCASMQ